MAEAAKYLFDRTFDVAVSSDAVASRQVEEEWERKMAEACCTAFEEGRAEGKTETLKSLEETIRAETGLLVDSSKRLLGDVEKECDNIRRNAIEIAVMTANLLAEELVARSPTVKLEALFSDALEQLNDAPHIALTVNDTLAEGIQKSVTSIASDRGFSGKIVVLGDPETKKGDCSLQWADGGISLDFDKTRDQISKLVRQHLKRLTGQTVKPDQAAESSVEPSPNHAEEPAQTLTPQSQPEIEPISETATGPGEMK